LTPFGGDGSGGAYTSGELGRWGHASARYISRIFWFFEKPELFLYLNTVRIVPKARLIEQTCDS
jgi:hypothetical protein